MPLINLDFDLENVSSSMDPIPPDQYAAKIVSAELVQSSTGKPMVKIKWEITEGEYAGRTLYDNLVLTVAWRVKLYAEIVGIESGSELDTDDFIGTEAILEVIQEEYDGEPKSKIKKIKSF